MIQDMKNGTREQWFAEKVWKGHRSGCWMWTGARTPQGYGKFGWQNGRSILAHRYAFFLATGTLPADRQICHRCDTPPCVNPAHLFAGTARENAQDAKTKGRLVKPPTHRGETHHKAKLSYACADAIRAAYAHGGTSQRRLAATFGVSQPVIGKVLRMESWVK